MTADEAWLFYLCLCLHVPHPDYLDTVLTEDQLADWKRFYNHYQFGSIRDDIRFGQLTHMVAQVQCTKHLKVESFTLPNPFTEKRQHRVTGERAMREAMREAARQAEAARGQIGKVVKPDSTR